MSAYENVLGRLSRVRHSGDHNASALCPAHDDRERSLSVTNGGDRVLLHCHAGCATEAVVSALGLSMRDLFDGQEEGERASRPASPAVVFAEDDVTRYREALAENSKAQERLEELRGWTPAALDALEVGFDSSTKERPIVFAARDGDGRLVGISHYSPNGKIEPKLIHAKGSRHQLFPRPEEVAGDELWLLEGHADAVRAHALGLPAVAVPGVNGWRPEWAGRLAGRKRVTIVFDCDAPGRAAAEKIAGELARVVEDVRVVDLDPSRDDGYDLSDFVAAAKTGEERRSAAAMLRDLAARHPRASTRGGASSPARRERVYTATPPGAVYDPASARTSTSTAARRAHRVDLLEYRFTDLGNAHRFVAMFGDRFRYSREEKRWLEWRDGRWRRDVTGAADRAAAAVVETLWEQVVQLEPDDREKFARWAIRSQSATQLRAMLTLAASDATVSVRLDQLDSDPYLFSCGNGTLNLRTGELREPNPDNLITLGTDVRYRPDAPRERWLQFLDEVFAEDQELIAFVKRAYGSMLTGDTRDRVLFIEYGSRFNGKSTLNNAIQNVIGDFAHPAPIRVVMRTRGSEIPNEIAALARKRFVLIAETADGHKLDENRVKALTGRDKVPARFLNREWFEFEPEYKLVLYTNFRPKVDGADGAIWDRIKLIPFTVSFEHSEDKDLSSKLAGEAEGILAWLVEGCAEWRKHGLGTCEAVEQATSSYRDENDTIGRFIQESCEFGEDHRVTAKQLRSALLSYCEDTGDDVPPTQTVGRWLKERGVRETRIDKARAYRGIRLNEAQAA